MKSSHNRAISAISYYILLLMVIITTFRNPSVGNVTAMETAPGATQISSCSQLQTIRDNLSGNYFLAQDIDCSATSSWNAGEGFLPIGTISDLFTGLLDGRGYAIHGLYINRPADWYVGLFAYTGADAMIRNVHLQSVSVTGKEQVGALIGTNWGTVSKCSSEGTVQATNGVVGGLVGYNSGTVATSHSSAHVTGGTFHIHYTGGLVGENRGIVRKSYASGLVSGEDTVGGLVGTNTTGTISQCYATGIVIGGNGYTGGLVGKNQYASSNSTAVIRDSYATGMVLGGSGAYATAGGLLGANGGTGWGTESVENCYSLGPVSGDDAGGLIGRNSNPAETVINSYWDVQASGIAVSAAGTGLTTSEMFQQSTYIGWDFDNIWMIREGRIYPWHKWHPFEHTDLITCEASGNQTFNWASPADEIVRECTVTVPENGIAMISADASLSYWDADYEAKFYIGVGGLINDGSTERWVNVNNTGPGGSRNTMALSKMINLTEGTHTIYLVVSRYSGLGTIVIWDSTLSVIFIPASSPDLLTCESSGNYTWDTTATSPQVIRLCALDLPTHGWIYMSADATTGIADFEYEGAFSLGVDGDPDAADIRRWVNIYGTTANDSDKTVTGAGLIPVAAGSHLFTLFGYRYGGTGTVRVYDPTLNVIYFPAPSLTSHSCTGSGTGVIDITGLGFTVLRECTIDLPADSWVYISANAGVNHLGFDTDAQFRIGIDNSSLGDWNIDRFVNVRGDTGDGSDNTVAITNLRWLTRGTHTIYFLGTPNLGYNPVRIHYPTLSVIALGSSKVHLPSVLRMEP